jgi:hypothetical protein
MRKPVQVQDYEKDEDEEKEEVLLGAIRSKNNAEQLI